MEGGNMAELFFVNQSHGGTFCMAVMGKVMRFKCV